MEVKGTEKNIVGYWWRTGGNDGTRQWIIK